MNNGPTSFDATDPVGSVFAQMTGLPAWGVKKGHGSFLIFEFGALHLSIHEPIAEPSSESPAIRKILQRRRVVPHGEWHLWIYCCHWRCTDKGIAHSTDESSDALIIAAADLLDGQRLMPVEAEPLSGTSRFQFDLGGTLETWPYDGDNDEQWTLFTPDGHVLPYRADGHYCWGPSSQTPDDEVWQPMPSPGKTLEI